MADNLVIVESPAKAKTIEKYLGSDYVVKASYGHIRDLEKSGLSVDVEHDFAPKYIIPEDKKRVVSELKAEVKKAKTVWLASDEDREGEAIAWHLNETLNLNKKDTKRIVFNEITKSAILSAVENPRGIDANLVNAQQARRVLDRIVGYEISPVLWRKVKPSLSAGRVQSVAVRLIVEKEKEIEDFVAEEYYKVSADFLTDSGNILKATLNNRFETEEYARNFLGKLNLATFCVKSVEKKPTKRSPQPPFTTSTLQQEASRRLGFSVSQTMLAAQQLYEQGLITYMRTDSVNLSDYALMQAKDVIPEIYGKEYLKTRRFTTKTKGAQEAHEAIRPTLLSRTEITGDNYQQKLYKLIWRRMIASQMQEAKLEKTDIEIEISNDENIFQSEAEVLLFDGFLKVYQVAKDEDENDEEENIIPDIKQGSNLVMDECIAKQSFSSKPARYNEATLVHRLEELGIGRPSTYAPTITTIQKRAYVEKRSIDMKTREIIVLRYKDGEINRDIKTENYGKETKKLFPTDIGKVVNTFLTSNFSDIMDYNFTAKVESSFDKIAEGKEDWTKMMHKFYTPFMKEVKQASESAGRERGQRLLGQDPETGKNVYAKIGRFGAIVQIGDSVVKGKNDENIKNAEKPRFASLRSDQSISTITLKEALALFSSALPRTVGQYMDADVVVSNGRFGAYIKWNGKNITLKREDNPYTISLDKCIEEIESKNKKDAIIKDLPKTIATIDDQPILLKYGRFGLYLQMGDKNYRIPKDKDAANLSMQDAIEIVNDKKVKK